MITRKLDIGNFNLGSDYAPTRRGIDPLVGSALITSGVNLVGGLFGAHKNNQNQAALMQKQIEAQKQLQRNQNQWNLEMWNKQNEYNTPFNQRSLYEDAGLNPSYFLGQGNGTAGSVQSSTMSAPSAPTPAGDYGFLGSIGSTILQQELLKSEIHKNNADAGYTGAMMKTEDLLRDAKLNFLKAQEGLTQAQKGEVDAKIENLKANTEYQKALKGLTDTDRQIQEVVLQYIPLMQKQQLENLKAEYELKLSEVGKNEALVESIKASIRLIDQQIKESESRIAVNNQEIKESNSRIQVNNQSINESKSRVKVNNASVKNINADTSGKNIQNEINEDTKGVQKVGEYVHVGAEAANGVGNLVNSLGSGAGKFVRSLVLGDEDNSTSNPSQNNNNNNNRRGNYKRGRGRRR